MALRIAVAGLSLRSPNPPCPRCNGFRHGHLLFLSEFGRNPLFTNGLQAANSSGRDRKQNRQKPRLQRGHSYVHYESRALPSFSINSYRVGRLTPSSNAAAVTFPI